ncbi:hypothetical protein [Euzebya sp.]|uniref:hypothetical protein n=1 Tax=Euzebya sp. TaxID=1971409 RepID=UPI0035199609
MSSEPRGAGPVGGLLFLAVVLVVGYLVITTIAGILKWLISAALVVVVILLAVRVLTRR